MTRPNKLTIVGATAFVLLFSFSAEGGPIVNGSFEDGLNGWTTYLDWTELSSDWASDGSYCVSLYASYAQFGHWEWIDDEWVPIYENDTTWFHSRISQENIEFPELQIPGNKLMLEFDWFISGILNEGDAFFKAAFRLAGVPESWSLYIDGEHGDMSGTQHIDVSAYAGGTHSIDFDSVAFATDTPSSDEIPGGEDWLNGASADFHVDNVRLREVPEPGSILLLAPGILGLAGVLRRRLR